MENVLYPWGGEFTIGSKNSCIAVCTLGEHLSLNPLKVALWGQMKTENLGIEKVIANVISNPNIRYLIVWGPEIIGHRCGSSIISAWKNGIDSGKRIIGARGAVPYIENINVDAIKRFQAQITIEDMLDNQDESALNARIDKCINNNPGTFGEPYYAIKMVEKEYTSSVSMVAEYALHKDMNVSIYFEITPVAPK